MEIIEFVDIDGRKYKAYSDGGDDVVKIGPPENLVDNLELPEPFATRLHNILYNRGLLDLQAIVKNGNGLLGALQEALAIDVQKLTEEFYRFQKE